MIETRVVISIASLSLGLKFFHPSKADCICTLWESPSLELIYHYSITCDIARLTKEKCHPPSKDHESWRVYPLTFVVDLPAHGNVIYVAVISQVEDVFVLHEVYQKQQRQLNFKLDIVLPQRSAYIWMFVPVIWSDVQDCAILHFRKYDIRVGDGCALASEADDDRVRQIADKLQDLFTSKKCGYTKLVTNLNYYTE